MNRQSFAEKSHWTSIAWYLVLFTLLYNFAEALIALWAGQRAESIALLGFGLDSIIEISASVMALWRLTVQRQGQPPDKIKHTEKLVRRYVGWTFIALAIYVSWQAGRTLYLREQPASSFVGIVLAAASIIIMPALAVFKLRAARHIESPALAAEAKETLACAYLSLTLLIGLLANWLANWWWADPLAALLMVPWLIKEGREGIEDKCCCGGADDQYCK